MENSLFLILLSAAFIHDGNAQDHGHPATEGQFKYAAYIWHSGRRRCNGAIITARHILTAGHCVYCRPTIDFRVLVGVVTLTSSTIWHRVRKTHLHSEYEQVYAPDGTPGLANNDIAIMELLNLLVFSDTIQSIPLSLESNSSPVLRCNLVWFRHADSPSIKKVDLSLSWDNVVITTHEDCTKLYPDLYPNERCVLNPLDTRSPVAGDSGAPIVCDDLLTAILTGGLPDMNYAAKALIVAPYINWMRDIICLRSRLLSTTTIS